MFDSLAKYKQGGEVLSKAAGIYAVLGEDEKVTANFAKHTLAHFHSASCKGE